jgi:hypothetical protein
MLIEYGRRNGRNNDVKQSNLTPQRISENAFLFKARPFRTNVAFRRFPGFAPLFWYKQHADDDEHIALVE